MQDCNIYASGNDVLKKKKERKKYMTFCAKIEKAKLKREKLTNNLPEDLVQFRNQHVDFLRFRLCTRKR